MADRGTVGARLDHVGLAVADLEAAVSWFCDVFGLVRELTLRVEPLDLSIEMLAHPVHGYRIELLHRPGSGAGRKPGTRVLTVRNGTCGIPTLLVERTAKA